MKMFQDSDGWNALRRVMLHTLATLIASTIHPDEVEQIRQTLERWRAIDVQRQEADNAVVIANARVAWADSALDEALTTFAAQLLLDCGSDRSHGIYTRFFPETVKTITSKSLDVQLRALKDFALFGEEIVLPDASARALTELLRVMSEGRAVLEARDAAEREVVRVSVAQAAWRDDANTVRRAVETSLQDYALRNALPRTYSARFHRPTYERKRSRKKKTGAPARPAQPAASSEASTASSSPVSSPGAPSASSPSPVSSPNAPSASSPSPVSSPGAPSASSPSPVSSPGAPSASPSPVSSPNAPSAASAASSPSSERTTTVCPSTALAALSPHEQVLALSDAVLHGLAEDFVASLPTNVQAIVRARRAR